MKEADSAAFKGSPQFTGWKTEKKTESGYSNKCLDKLQFRFVSGNTVLWWILGRSWAHDSPILRLLSTGLQVCVPYLGCFKVQTPVLMLYFSFRFACCGGFESLLSVPYVCFVSYVCFVLCVPGCPPTHYVTYSGGWPDPPALHTHHCPVPPHCI